MRKQRRVVAQQLVRAQQQLGEIDQAGPIAAFLVQRVRLLHHVQPGVSGRWLQVLRTLALVRSEEHTSELQSLMRISYAVFCLKKKYLNTHQIALVCYTNKQ